MSDDKYIDIFNDILEYIKTKYFKSDKDVDISLLKVSFKLNKYEYVMPQYIQNRKITYIKTQDNRIYADIKFVDSEQNIIKIIKYRPLTDMFFVYNEIIKQFKLNIKSKILEIAVKCPSFVEAVHYTNDDVIDVIINDKDDEAVKHLDQYIPFNNVNIDDKTMYDIICVSSNDFIKLDKLIDKLNDNGTMIVYVALDNNKLDHIKYFEEVNCYIPLVLNPLIISGFYLILSGYNKNNKNIFDNKIFKNTINQIYHKKSKFIEKIKNMLDMNDAKQKKYLKQINDEQIMDAILYAVRFDYDYYKLDDTSFIDKYMERNILMHMYSIDIPVIFTFKHSTETDKVGIPPFFEQFRKKVYMNNFLIDTRNLDDWERITKQVRYYSPVEKYINLKVIVSEKFGVKTSQAWLKMYEMIIDNNLIKQTSGEFKTFHLCEAPGSFIAALNHYIKTETKLKFDWKAQSLNPFHESNKGRVFGDDFGYMKNYPENWIWGEDQTGDITKEHNIRFYKKYCTDVKLMTSDCGITHDRRDTELTAITRVHFAELLFILHNLPEGSDFLVKLYMTQHTPIQISMLYLIYQSFDSMTFYKGVVNVFSMEFYMIGKGYKGIDKQMEQKLFDILNNFDPEIDLFKNNYSEDFMFQMEYGLQKLFDNYKIYFNRQLFYVDNYKYIDQKYLKKIKGAIKDKNNDWIRRMHLKQIGRHDVL